MDRAFSTPAIQIAEDLLDRTGRGLLTGDFELFAPCFVLPQEYETFRGMQCVRDLKELRLVFESMRTLIREDAITDMVRTVLHADYKDQNTIECTHETRMLSGNRLVQPPYPVLSTYLRAASGWQVKRASYAICDNPRHETALMDFARFEPER